MKKPQQVYDLEIPNDDYKMAAVMERDRKNFESSDKWLYVAADRINPGYAKIGITMGDLTSRSYSTANPHYHLFCAFQCDQDTTVEKLKEIERGALNYLDKIFCYEGGETKRARHMESNRLSECYYDVNFDEFFSLFHDYLIDNHTRHLLTCGYESNDGVDLGYALAWQFNTILSPEVQKRFLHMILRY